MKGAAPRVSVALQALLRAPLVHRAGLRAKAARAVRAAKKMQALPASVTRAVVMKRAPAPRAADLGAAVPAVERRRELETQAAERPAAVPEAERPAAAPEAGGGWFADNALGVHPDGTDTGYEAAVHPPALKADKPVDLTFNCGGAAHTELDFQLYRPGGGVLTLLVDGAVRQTLTAYNNQWLPYAIVSASAAHVYTFRASSSTDAASSFVLDTLVCK